MNDIIKITSRSNSVIKKVVEMKSSPCSEKFIIEGAKFIKDIDIECIIELFTTQPDKYEEIIIQLQNKNIPIYFISEEVMDKICDVNSGVNILCVIKKPLTERPDKLIILDEIQDPGNVGTIIRTATAFGFGIIAGNGTANPFSSKIVRSSAGALLNCHLINTELVTYIENLKREGFIIFSSELDETAETLSLQDQNIKKCAIIIGNEGAGVSKLVSKTADKKIYIPMNRGLNSLNAAIAAGIIMYHFNNVIL
ncbi:MAG: rRNA methyltransferase [Clostridia bacterium]|nr:rRNA methyltransferase [Clostridia bacterium]